jgi:DNA-binding GntR family transcriptional regulator
VSEPATNVLVRLRDDLTSFRLRPGERLIEEELSQRYGVSRTPVREALRVLEQKGLVVEDKRGRRSVPHFDIAVFEDIYRVRAGLERLAVVQACERGTNEQIAELARSWDVTLDEDESIEYYRSDERFHSGIARLSGNEFLIDALARVDDRIRIIRLVDFTSPDRVTRTRDEHTEILDAMVAGDGGTASRLIGEHVDEAMTNVRELVTRALAKVMLED